MRDFPLAATELADSGTSTNVARLDGLTLQPVSMGNDVGSTSAASVTSARAIAERTTLALTIRIAPPVAKECENSEGVACAVADPASARGCRHLSCDFGYFTPVCKMAWSDVPRLQVGLPTLRRRVRGAVITPRKAEAVPERARFSRSGGSRAADPGQPRRCYQAEGEHSKSRFGPWISPTQSVYLGGQVGQTSLTVEHLVYA